MRESTDSHPGAGLEVLIVEDDSMVRAWLRAALRGTEFRIAAETSNVRDAFAVLARRRIDLLLVDFRLPDREGTWLTRELRRSGDATPVVLMTSTPTEGFNELAREAGAQGTLLKSAERSEVLAGLRSAASGTARFAPEHPRRPAERGALSARERQVLTLVAEGRTNREIATALALGPETVKTLLERTYEKLGVRNRVAAVVAARRVGMLD